MSKKKQQVFKTFILTCWKEKKFEPDVHSDRREWRVRSELAVRKLKVQFNVQPRDDKISEISPEHDVYFR